MLYLFIGIPLAILAFIVIPHTLLEESYHQRNWVDAVGGAAVFGLILLNLFTDWDWIVYAMGVVLVAYLVAQHFIKPKR